MTYGDLQGDTDIGPKLRTAEVKALTDLYDQRRNLVDELISLYEDVIQEFQQNDHGEKLTEDRAAAAYLRQLKVDFNANTAAAIRLREHLERVPLVGRLGIKLARAAMRRK